MKLVPAATGELKTNTTTELFSTISGHISAQIIKVIKICHVIFITIKHFFNQFCNAERTSYYWNTHDF